MKSSKIFILGLSLIVIAKWVYSYNWPFAKTNEQVPITGVIGEFTGNPGTQYLFPFN
ncbi:MAG: hypothetical protein AB1414_05525 [bacterium]